MIRLGMFSYGGAAAIVTSVALVIGLDAATGSKATIVSGLLIVALADNLTDSLSIHIYQESERLDSRAAFFSTLTNFAARLATSLSFVALVLLLPIRSAILATSIWGLLLLSGLTWVLARERGRSVFAEMFKHVAVALAVILASKQIGAWIGAHVGAP
ncbi:MAG TPA: hypothetical protein VMH32_05925 [Burkholderiales bacterium]|nr:hypothetical protein [Burkholderiales bacterium]